MGVVSPLSEILLLSKNGQISLWGMDYSPWSSKNLIDRNRLKKFMQVGVDVTCMYTDFGGCGHSTFGDIATFKKRPNFPFGAWTIVHGHQKILSIGIGSKKFMQVGVDVTCMYTDFGGCGLSTFGDIATFKKQPNFPFGAWTIVHAHQKI